MHFQFVSTSSKRDKNTFLVYKDKRTIEIRVNSNLQYLCKIKRVRKTYENHI